MKNSSSLSISNIFLTPPGKKIIGGVVFALAGLAMLQDYLQSRFQNSPFYFSESLLFRSFWILFVPGVLMQIYLLTNLNTRFPSLPRVLRRVITVIMCTFIHMATFSVCVYILSLICLDHTYYISGTFFYTLGEDLSGYLLFYGVVGMCYNIKPKAAIAPSNLNATIIWVDTGTQKISLNIEDIILITAASPYIVLHTKDKKYIHSDTLKSISEKLPAAQFIRVHKSSIINIKKVVASKSRLNGDYDIMLDNDKEVRLSRNYAAVFKKAFY